MPPDELLFITQNVPREDRSGGETRQWRLATELARRFRVTVAVYLRGEEERAAARVLEKRGIRVEGVPFDHAVHGSDRFSRLLPDRVAELINTGRFRAVQVEKFWMAICVERFIGPRATRPAKTCFVLDELDVEMIREQRRADRLPEDDPKRAQAMAHAMDVRRRETEAVPWFDRVLAVSEEDARALRPIAGDDRVFVVPLAVDLERFAAGAREERPDPILVFVASFAHNPNADGMAWFARDVFPLVRRHKPRAELLAVGHSPPPRVLALGDIEGVEITGAVPDVRPYLARARVAVAPLRYGGGVKNKVLEALAAGLPVASTSVGAEGLSSIDPAVLRVGDDPGVLAGEILSLLAAPEDRRALARTCRKEVGREFSVDRVGALVREAYAGLE